MKHLMMFWFPRFQIDSLTGLGVVKVECGSQFSVALTKSGAVYTWYVQRGAVADLSRLHRYKRWFVCIPVSCVTPPRGKGDYHRLGHGSDDHVRRPRQVQGLQGKKVIAIATGSLHCVCCTEDGRSDR